MQRFTEGNRVRVDIPDQSDPDHERYHGRHGTVIEDSGDEVTGDERDNILYRIELEDGETADFRWRNLRPPISE